MNDFLNNLFPLVEFQNKNDEEFFKQVFSQEQTFYKKRLEDIGFLDKNVVLDAGCGFGQWSLALSELNKLVYAVDLQEDRIKNCLKINNYCKKNNIFLGLNSIENLSFMNESFDAIFCYSVIYSADFDKAIKEFYRILKPQGKLYFVSNGLGWYLKSLFEKTTTNFNKRKHAINSIISSLEFQIFRQKKADYSLILSQDEIRKQLESVGFKKVIIKEEGFLSKENNIISQSAYRKKILFFSNVFEVLTEK